MKNAKRLVDTYKYFLDILMKHAPLMVISVFVLAIVSGFLSPLSVYVNTNIFNVGISIAEGNSDFHKSCRSWFYL